MQILELEQQKAQEQDIMKNKLEISNKIRDISREINILNNKINSL